MSALGYDAIYAPVAPPLSQSNWTGRGWAAGAIFVSTSNHAVGAGLRGGWRARHTVGIERAGWLAQSLSLVPKLHLGNEVETAIVS